MVRKSHPTLTGVKIPTLKFQGKKDKNMQKAIQLYDRNDSLKKGISTEYIKWRFPVTLQATFYKQL